MEEILRPSGTLTRRGWLTASAALGGAVLARRPAARAAEPPLEAGIVNTDGTGERVLSELIVEQGYYRDQGLDPKVDFIFGSGKIMDALLSGRSDICMGSGVSSVIAAIAGGAPLRLLAGANQRVVQAIFSAKPEVKTMKDLEGRRVGSGPKGQLIHQLTVAAMLKAGADPDKVDFVNLGNSAMIFQAVVKGEIDAGSGEAYVFDDQAKYGVHAVQGGVFWDVLPDYINQASYASLAAIKAKRAALTRALAANCQAYRFLQTPGSEAAYAKARVAALGPGDPAETHTQWRFYQRFKPFAVKLVLEEPRIRYIQQLNVRMGLQKAVVPFDAIVDSSLAKEALGRVNG